jgi:hypothetical protein
MGGRLAGDSILYAEDLSLYYYLYSRELFGGYKDVLVLVVANSILST